MPLHDMARTFVASAPGTGPIFMGAAISGFQTFAASGAIDGEYLGYNLTDFDATGVQVGWEVGGPTLYNAAGPSLVRAPLFSSNANAAINASAFAQVALTALATDWTPNVSIFTANASFVQLLPINNRLTIIRQGVPQPTLSVYLPPTPALNTYVGVKIGGIDYRVNIILVRTVDGSAIDGYVGDVGFQMTQPWSANWFLFDGAIWQIV